MKNYVVFFYSQVTEYNSLLIWDFFFLRLTNFINGTSQQQTAAI